MVPNFCIRSSSVPYNALSKDPDSALQLLARHWRQLWHRRCNWRSAFDKLKEVRPRALPAQEWASLSLEAVKKALGKQRGKSAGGDHWTACEVADLPDAVLSVLLQFYALFIKEGHTPSVWKLARQCHIPKQGAAQDVVDAAKLRPITVLSVWYRALSGPLLKGASEALLSTTPWPRLMRLATTASLSFHLT